MLAASSVQDTIPAVWSYVSDGAYKEYAYDNTTIKFKRTANKLISGLSEKSALLIQALKALGKDKMTEEVIETIKSELNAAERNTMLKEAQCTTAWIYKEIKRNIKIYRTDENSFFYVIINYRS